MLLCGGVIIPRVGSALRSWTRGYTNEGVAEPPLVKAPRIGYFGRIGDFSRFVRIFDSQDVENRLYNKKTAKIGLFRPIFVCFYAISGY